MVACIIQRCEEPAPDDDLCAGHAKKYRPEGRDLCPRCRRQKLSTAIDFERGFCRMCRASEEKGMAKEKKRMTCAPMKPGTRDCQECGKDMAGEHCRAMRHKGCRPAKAARKRKAARKKVAAKKAPAERAEEFEQRKVPEFFDKVEREEECLPEREGVACNFPPGSTAPEPEPTSPCPDACDCSCHTHDDCAGCDCAGCGCGGSPPLSLIERLEELEKGVPEVVLKLGRAVKELRDELDELQRVVLGSRAGEGGAR